MRKRTLARQIAMEALYQLDLLGNDHVGEPGLFCARRSGDEEVREFALRLIEGWRARRNEIDKEIETVAENWSLSRMACVDRAILRIGAYELMFCDDVPPKVAINEAIELAKKFGSEDSGDFVNALLDKIRIRQGKKIAQ